MVSLDELRTCKSCGNVFSKKAGVSIISECPQCHGISFEPISVDGNSDEEVYLDELD
jgi:predicted Zn-ribbon and HTH transcriptional regulator